jgi:hypothetical protein
MQPIREQRHDQIYPTLDPLEVERVRRFGEVRSFPPGECTCRKLNPDVLVVQSAQNWHRQRQRTRKVALATGKMFTDREGLKKPSRNKTAAKLVTCSLSDLAARRERN